eukprot:gene27820-16051_t
MFGWANDSERPLPASGVPRARGGGPWGPAHTEASRLFWDAVLSPHCPDLPQSWELAARPGSGWAEQCGPDSRTGFVVGRAVARRRPQQLYASALRWLASDALPDVRGAGRVRARGGAEMYPPWMGAYAPQKWRGVMIEHLWHLLYSGGMDTWGGGGAYNAIGNSCENIEGY